jgi:hypothetical protein
MAHPPPKIRSVITHQGMIFEVDRVYTDDQGRNYTLIWIGNLRGFSDFRLEFTSSGGNRIMTTRVASKVFKKKH